MTDSVAEVYESYVSLSGGGTCAMIRRNLVSDTLKDTALAISFCANRCTHTTCVFGERGIDQAVLGSVGEDLFWCSPTGLIEIHAGYGLHLVFEPSVERFFRGGEVLKSFLRVGCFKVDYDHVTLRSPLQKPSLLCSLQSFLGGVEFLET